MACAAAFLINSPPLLPFLRTLLLNLPTDLADDDTPDHSLYHLLCAYLDADQNTLSSNANTLLPYLHPDKSPNPDDPALIAAAHLVPLFTHKKCVLTQTSFRLVYDHCSLTGFQRLLTHKLGCIHFMPVDATGRSFRWNSCRISSARYFAHLKPLNLLSSLRMRPRNVVCDSQGAIWWLLLPFFCVVCTPMCLSCVMFSVLTRHTFWFQLPCLLLRDAHLRSQFPCCRREYTPWWRLWTPPLPRCIAWVTLDNPLC